MTNTATYAFGELSRSPSYYRGEQYDSDLGLYYLRARYYNPATGRFLSRDPLDGQFWDPKTLHKYLYAGKPGKTGKTGDRRDVSTPSENRGQTGCFHPFREAWGT